MEKIEVWMQVSVNSSDLFHRGLSEHWTRGYFILQLLQLKNKNPTTRNRSYFAPDKWTNLFGCSPLVPFTKYNIILASVCHNLSTSRWLSKLNITSGLMSFRNADLIIAIDDHNFSLFTSNAISFWNISLVSIRKPYAFFRQSMAPGMSPNNFSESWLELFGAKQRDREIFSELSDIIFQLCCVSKSVCMFRYPFQYIYFICGSETLYKNIKMLILIKLIRHKHQMR